MEYSQSISRINEAEAAFYIENTQSALDEFNTAKQQHRKVFGSLAYVRGIWA